MSNTKPLNDFIRRFKSNTRLDVNFIVKEKNRYFLLDKNLKRRITEASKSFFHAGVYLGKFKGGVFFPSFIMLTIIAEKKANKTVVDEKTEWLFICGRDVFKRGILQVAGSKRKGDLTLILNRHDECLGFGKILRNVDKERNMHAIIVKNILDLGDLLRRER